MNEDNMDINVDCDKQCCLNCAFFESRTGFCRRNPPIPVQVTSGRNPYCVGMFPKIGMPAIDFCAEFKKKD